MKYKVLFMISTLFLLWGCDKEDKIEVRKGLEESYTLPQGDHDYDSEIMAWFEKYGFYTLYIYENKDIYWANTNWEERFEDRNKYGGGSLKAEKADPNHVGKLLDLFKYSFIDLYPDSLLTNYMPLKVLCCSELWNTIWMFDHYDPAVGMVMKLNYDKLWAYQGWDYIAINGGNSEIDTLGKVSQMQFSKDVNTVFIKRLYEAGKIKMTEKFASISDYTESGYFQGDACFSRGFIITNPLGYTSEEARKEADFEAYMNLIGMPLLLLEAEPNREYDYDETFYKMSLLGALHPMRDVNGLVRAKYEAIIEVLKDMGIDTDRLQKGYIE